MGRVLIMSPFAGWPLFGGVAVRIHHLVERLSRRHRVWFVCRGGVAPPGVDCTPVASSRSRWLQLLDPGLLLRMRSLVVREGIDTAVFSSILTGLHGPLLKALTGVRLVFDDHNVEHRVLRRLGSPLWPAAAALETLLCRTADRVTCVSEVDRRALLDLGVPPGRVKVFPNGADVAALRREAGDPGPLRRSLGVAEGEALLLFFGVLSYAPNTRAARVLVDEVAPRLDRAGLPYRLVVAGTGAEAVRRGHPKVSFCGFVEEIRPLLQAADLVVVPLETGSGTRLKILEAAACGKAVVTTTLGAEGLDRACFGDGLVVADGWDDFAGAVVRCLEERVASPPSPEFLKTYDWGEILADYPEGEP